MPPKTHKPIIDKKKPTSSRIHKPDIVIDDLMTFAAFRYCLGRATYIVSHCADYLCKHWDQIHGNTKKLIHKEIRKAFETKSYGMEMDKEEWQKVLDLKV